VPLSRSPRSFLCCSRRAPPSALFPYTTLFRSVGKSDPLDARAIATAAALLESVQRRFPRLADGARAGLRVLLGAREHMTFERIAKVNALTALLRSVELGVDDRSYLFPPEIGSISRWRRH